MTTWCIHTRRKTDGAIIKAQIEGPPDIQRIREFAERTLSMHAPDHELVMIHEESPTGVSFMMPEFNTAIENMIYQGMAVVGALAFAAHFIINKQKEQDS